MTEMFQIFKAEKGYIGYSKCKKSGKSLYQAKKNYAVLIFNTKQHHYITK